MYTPAFGLLRLCKVSSPFPRCRSRHQLSYQQAQDAADRRSAPAAFTPGQILELRAMLDLLVSVTDAWRQRRLEVACT